MAHRRGVVRHIDPPKTTVAVNGSSFDSRFTPNWDEEPGAGQEVVRLEKRDKMGVVTVPRGAGVATRQRR